VIQFEVMLSANYRRIVVNTKTPTVMSAFFSELQGAAAHECDRVESFAGKPAKLFD
jgi:hypothetical protein